MTAIETRNVGKIFTSFSVKVTALADISLTFERGTLTIIKGPSGSGKTTLVSILGCLLSPTSGTITILGKETGSLSRKELSALRLNKIGFIFQNFNLLGALTVRENVAIVNRLKGISRSESADNASVLISEVGLGNRENFLPKNLSQGEQQRVAIARAFMNDPEIIIADEPTANLDSKTGRDIIGKIKGLGKKKTVIIATHDERIIEMADRIVPLEDGYVTRVC